MRLIYQDGKAIMLKDKTWLIPNCMCSRQKAGGQGREFPIVAAAYQILVKQQGKSQQESGVKLDICSVENQQKSKPMT